MARVEGGRTNILGFEQLEKDILGLREQLDLTTETVVLKDQELLKLNNRYRTLRQTECHIAQNLAQEKSTNEETTGDRNALKLLMRELGGRLWSKGCR